MHPAANYRLAKERVRDLSLDADRHRLARDARRTRRSTSRGQRD
jgi:hypothetical protein